jgi:sulfonate transport system permease protein
VGLPALILVAWQAAASFGWITDAVMPSPFAVAAATWRLTLSGELPQNLGVSALRALAGLLVGGGIGLALGLLNGLSRLSFSVTDTSVQMIRNVPHLALIPLVIVWFGIEEGAKLFIVTRGQVNQTARQSAGKGRQRLASIPAVEHRLSSEGPSAPSWRAC